MWIRFLQTLQLSEISAHVNSRHCVADADIDASIAVCDATSAVDYRECVENVSQVLRGQLIDASAFASHTPRSEIANDAHRLHARGGRCHRCRVRACKARHKHDERNPGNGESHGPYFPDIRCTKLRRLGADIDNVSPEGVPRRT